MGETSQLHPNPCADLACAAISGDKKRSTAEAKKRSTARKTEKASNNKMLARSINDGVGARRAFSFFQLPSSKAPTRDPGLGHGFISYSWGIPDGQNKDVGSVKKKPAKKSNLSVIIGSYRTATIDLGGHFTLKQRINRASLRPTTCATRCDSEG